MRSAWNIANICGLSRESINVSGDILRAVRAVLAGWLVQRDGCMPEEIVACHGTTAVVDACAHEGGVRLVHACRSERAVIHSVPPDLLQALATRTRSCAAINLLCVSEARNIQQALTDAGIPAIWQKGIALGHWLYPRAHLRDIADIDLLLPDHATTLRAAQVLAPLGYTLPNPHIAGDLGVHELLAWSDRAQVELDLHWDLSNGALFVVRVPWLILLPATLPLPGLGAGAKGSSPRDAFRHAYLHRAINMLTRREDRLRWLYDIHLLALRFDADAWQQVLHAAQQAHLADARASALHACQRVFAAPFYSAVAVPSSAAAGNVTTWSSKVWSKTALRC